MMVGTAGLLPIWYRHRGPAVLFHGPGRRSEIGDEAGERLTTARDAVGEIPVMR